MKKLTKHYKNQSGLTLIEVLAALVITAFISILAINILLNGLDSYKKISQDTLMRDEADYLMSQLIKDIYTTKSSTVIGIVNPTGNSTDSYIQVKSGNNPVTHTGFKKNSASRNIELVIKNQIIPLNNSNISIDPTSKIVSQDDGGYLVLLKIVNKSKVIEFQNVVYPIPDFIENEEGV